MTYLAKSGREGSSPLTRGARPGAVPLSRQRGHIPAHAGSTRSRLVPASASTAHPRSRGEHDQRNLIDLRVYGSSPLTRGALAVEDLPTAEERLIPAHAGSTWSAS